MRCIHTLLPPCSLCGLFVDPTQDGRWFKNLGWVRLVSWIKVEIPPLFLNRMLTVYNILFNTWIVFATCIDFRRRSVALSCTLHLHGATVRVAWLHFSILSFGCHVINNLTQYARSNYLTVAHINVHRTHDILCSREKRVPFRMK